LLIGGSPCQSFSFAGKRKGMSTKDEQQILTLDQYLEFKNEGFEFEGQSFLFWEYMRLLNEIRTKNPNVFFLLENVMMTENWERVLSGAIGVHPIEINSALVSAQNRRRLYWTNIGLEPAGLFGDLESIIMQPKDKGILLKDILQDNPNAKYYLSDKAIDFYKNNNQKNIERRNGYRFEPTEGNRKAKVLKTIYDMDSNFIFCKNISEKYYLSDKIIKTISKTKNAEMVIDNNGKSMCLKANYHKLGRDNQFICEPVSEKYYLSDKLLNWFEQNSKKNIERGNGFKFKPTEGNKKSSTVTPQEGSQMDDNFIICHSGQRRSENRPSVLKNKNAGGTGPLSRTDGKTYCLDHTSFSNFVEKKNKQIRRLTPVECERLQTVPDNYTNHVSDTQRYRMLGNGWTVDVIVHILNYLPKIYKK
jgi:DNA (cytosine-5)-methyltransferase 3A